MYTKFVDSRVQGLDVDLDGRLRIINRLPRRAAGLVRSTSHPTDLRTGHGRYTDQAPQKPRAVGGDTVPGRRNENSHGCWTPIPVPDRTKSPRPCQRAKFSSRNRPRAGIDGIPGASNLNAN
jgi:hypothetical protein